MPHEEREAKNDMDERGEGGGTKYRGWHEQGKCALPIHADCWCQTYCQVNLATLR